MNEVKIALTGQLRAGKSEVSTILAGSYGFNEVAFGDALKRFAHETFPHVPAEPKPRALYQAFGQALRNMPVDGAEDVWVEHAMSKVGFYLDQAAISERNGDALYRPHIVISDLRQPNEYKRLRAEGFTIVRVTAPADIRLARAKQAGDAFTDADLAHETESHVDGFAVDFEIDNSGDYGELRAQVDGYMTWLGVEPTGVTFP